MVRANLELRNADTEAGLAAVNTDPRLRTRVLDRFLALSGASLLAYALASHAVRTFLSEVLQLIEKAVATIGGP